MPVSVLFIGARALGTGSAASVSLLLFSLPTVLMMVLAAVGLIMRKPFGYWCAYLATFFGGVFGIKTPFVPFVSQYVNLGPSTGKYFLILNLILIVILAWEHWTEIEAEGGERITGRRWTLIGMLLAAAVSVAIGLTSERIFRQDVSSSSSLPVIGTYFAPLEAANNSTIRCVIVHNRLFDFVEGVITGTASEEAVRKLAEHHGWRQLDRPEAYGKILPKARRWKLNEKGFLTDFSPPDLLFIGRPKNRDKAVIQLAWNKEDSRFTAEIFGGIAEGSR